MKKNIARMIATTLAVTGFSAFGWCQRSEKTAPVSVSVSDNFNLNLVAPNASGINFGPHSVGDEMFDTIGLSVNANHGISWTLTLSAAPLTNTDDNTTTIPGAGFNYNIAGGNGTHVPASGVAPVPASETTIYTADASEYNSSGLGFGLGIKVNIPNTQKSGPYSTTLNLALVDTF